MANPNKNSADYFSHDCDMRNDIKIRALRHKYGITGYAVWCLMLETLTGSNNFQIDYNEMNQELVSADFGIDVELFKEIISYCVKLHLFELANDGTLFSKKLKQRFSSIEERREKRAEAGKKGMFKRWNGKEPDNNVITTDNNVITTDNNVITTDNNVIEPANDNTIFIQNPKKRLSSNEGRSGKSNNNVITTDNNVTENDNNVTENDNNVITKGQKPITPNNKIKEKEKKETINKEIQKKNSKEKSADADKAKTAQRFSPPTLEEVRDYIASKSCRIDAEAFWNFYESKGWMVGSNKMKNWHSAVATWVGRDKEQNPGKYRDEAKQKLGYDEYVSGDGRRTYGSGDTTVPLSAPPRPSENYHWSAESNSWVFIP